MSVVFITLTFLGLTTTVVTKFKNKKADKYPFFPCNGRREKKGEEATSVKPYASSTLQVMGNVQNNVSRTTYTRTGCS
jgi:hypothetical protein